MMNPKRSLVRFDSGKVSLAHGLNTFLQALAPLGPMKEVIAEIIACRIEIRRIQSEDEKIRSEHQTRKLAIEANHDVMIRSVENRRMTMEKFFQHAENEMKQHRIFGNQIILTIQEMNKLISQKNVSSEEKQYAHETIKALSGHLVAAQSAAAASLEGLAKSALQELQFTPSFSELVP